MWPPLGVAVVDSVYAQHGTAHRGLNVEMRSTALRMCTVRGSAT